MRARRHLCRFKERELALFIGDPVLGGGFRLIGIDVKPSPPSPDALWRLLNSERQNRQLIILSRPAAEPIRDRIDEMLETRPIPPIMILPEAADDVDRSIVHARLALGLETV